MLGARARPGRRGRRRADRRNFCWPCTARRNCGCCRCPSRAPCRNRATASRSNQKALLDHVLEAEAPEKTLIVPVIGAPGTGKSHLVRWMLAALPDREDLVVRHIPREGTSLPQVVTTIFDGLEGDVFDDLRNAMAHSVSADDGRWATTTASSGSRRDCSAAWRRTSSSTEGIRWEVSREVDQAMRRCPRGLLPTLLREQGVLDRLRRPGGAAYRLAKLIVEGQDTRSTCPMSDSGSRPTTSRTSLRSGDWAQPPCAPSTSSVCLVRLRSRRPFSPTR